MYVNLSPQRYLQYREEKTATDAQRDVFVQYVTAAGAKPWVQVAAADGKRPVNSEVTCWRKGDTLYFFVLQNAAVSGSALGGGGVEGLAAAKFPITVSFASPMRDVTDERTGKKLGDGQKFSFDYNAVEAVMLSARATP